MFDFFKNDKGMILLLIFIFLIILPFFYLRQGLLLIDTGREFYIPSQILNGEILYKNIYNIYGALSYQFNAILFALFGQKLNTLYIAGILNSLIITLTLYLLSREFLPKNISFLVALVIIFELVFPVFLYNSNLTYAFAIVYALSSFLLSVLFLIKYLKNGNNITAFLSCFFAGISIANKYEFILYPLILIYVFCFLKPLGFKNILKAISCFLIVPFISYGVLFLQGLNFNDLKQTFILLQNLINAPSLNLFFRKTGAFFDIYYLKSLIMQNKIFAVFAVIPILNIILSAVSYKKIYENKALFVFILCSIIACAKSFIYLNINHMGIFIFPVCFPACIILLSKYCPKQLLLILSFCILIFLANDFTSLKDKNYFLETQKGNIYTYKKDGIPVKQAEQYILNNTKETDKVVVLPEGSIINFITGRKSDNFYYNLSPLFYNDVFKEYRIINDFNNNPPEYIIILPINNIEYGSSFFGIDYAQNFYEMIISKYNLTEEKNNIKFFKRKNI